MEIIVVDDGSDPSVVLDEFPDVTLLYHDKNQGRQRQEIPVWRNAKENILPFWILTTDGAWESSKSKYGSWTPYPMRLPGYLHHFTTKARHPKFTTKTLTATTGLTIF